MLTGCGLLSQRLRGQWMFKLQVRCNTDEGWLTIQEVDNIEFGLYRVAYFFECWEPNDYRLIDADERVVSLGKKEVVCITCRQKKMLAAEFHHCFSCLEPLNGY
jgi:hypothetical protein